MTRAKPAPRASSKPGRGAADRSLRDAVLMTAFMSAVTLGAVSFVLPIMLQDYRDARALKSRGVEATAQVLATWTFPGSARSSPSYHARFAFRAGSGATPVVDEAYVTQEEYAGLAPGVRVPIVYDPQARSLAALNIGDKVHRRRPLVETVGWIALLTAILAMAWVAAIIMLREVVEARRRAAAGTLPGARLGAPHSGRLRRQDR